ncbi:MAG: cupredoxin domain-containing protein, partial [Thermoanaerobaculia bacterium]
MRIAKLVVAVALVMPSLLFAATVNVSVGPGFSFSPPTVTVAPGDTVRWNFLATHTTTSDLQTGPEVWDSGLMSSGFFTHTFNTPGNYPYYCFLHSSPGGTFMNGVVPVWRPRLASGSSNAAGRWTRRVAPRRVWKAGRGRSVGSSRMR